MDQMGAQRLLGGLPPLGYTRAPREKTTGCWPPQTLYGTLSASDSSFYKPAHTPCSPLGLAHLAFFFSHSMRTSCTLVRSVRAVFLSHWFWETSRSFQRFFGGGFPVFFEGKCSLSPFCFLFFFIFVQIFCEQF